MFLFSLDIKPQQKRIAWSWWFTSSKWHLILIDQENCVKYYHMSNSHRNTYHLGKKNALCTKFFHGKLVTYYWLDKVFVPTKTLTCGKQNIFFPQLIRWRIYLVLAANMSWSLLVSIKLRLLAMKWNGGIHDPMINFHQKKIFPWKSNHL